MEFKNLKQKRIFEIFGEICTIPHGSGNCELISKYCVDFANRIGLKHYTDDAGNVVIFKNGTTGFENKPPVILQGHIDMVCQKDKNSSVNFEIDSLSVFYDGDFVFADGTTLGGDNGIAVAMIFAILESDTYAHPPIEAVFTADEEIGMIGAGKLDMSVLSAKQMINLDAEEDDSVIVSCAGGCDINIEMPLKFCDKFGSKLSVEIKGLKGGHSGVEIGNGRINSNILAGRILNSLPKESLDIIAINGGNKGNAITNFTTIELCSSNPLDLKDRIDEIFKLIFNEIKLSEPNFIIETNITTDLQEFKVLDEETKSDIIYVLGCMPNGVIEMSAEIDNLVETSLNLGILQTNDNSISLLTSLRSNKQTALLALADKINLFFSKVSCNVETSGFYPPWEFKSGSKLQKIYIEAYQNVSGETPKVEAIHAGLECAVFASKIEDIDCIAIGPNLYDVHTVNEKLSISSTEKVFNILIEVLKNL